MIFHINFSHKIDDFKTLEHEWTQTTVWWWREGRRSGGWKEGGKGGENGDICNKNKEKNHTIREKT